MSEPLLPARSSFAGPIRFRENSFSYQDFALASMDFARKVNICVRNAPSRTDPQGIEPRMGQRVLHVQTH
jgi:hypothetical protein